MVNKKRKREARYADTRRRETEHQTGSRPSLKLPRGLGFFNPKKPDVYNVTILPYEVGPTSKKYAKGTTYAEEGELYYERTYFAHRGIGPEESSVICLTKTFGKPCPVCEHAVKLAQSVKSDDESVKALRPKERQLFLVLDRDDAKKGPQLWDVSYHLFGVNLDEKINKASDKKKEAYRQFFRGDEKGLDLRVTAKEKSMGPNKFNEFFVDEFEEREEGLDEKLLNHGICLDDVPAPMKYEDLKKLLQGEADGDDDEATVKEEEENEKDEEDEGEEEEENVPEFEKGMFVTGVYRKKQFTGPIVKIDKKGGNLHIDIDEEHPRIVAMDDPSLEIVEGDTGLEDEEEEEEVEKPQRGKKTAAKEEEEDDSLEDEDEDEDEDEEDDALEDEDEEPAPQRASKKPAARGRR